MQMPPQVNFHNFKDSDAVTLLAYFLVLEHLYEAASSDLLVQIAREFEARALSSGLVDEVSAVCHIDEISIGLDVDWRSQRDGSTWHTRCTL